MKKREFKLTNLSVANKTTIYIFTVILVIFGFMQYDATPKERFPEIVFPYFMVSTIHPGTSPADMENLFTRPIEKHLKGIDGVKHISSNSIQDFSSIFIEFELTADEMQAYLDVRQAVDDARGELPSDLFEEPEVTRIDLSEIPILFINLSGDLGLVKLKKIAEDLQDEIEGLEEITRADIVGALDREIQINVDLYKMQAADLSFFTIQNAIASENLTISGGQVDTDGIRRNLRVVGEFRNIDQIKNIQLKKGVYLREIAEVVDGYADRGSYSRLSRQDVVTLNVIKKSGKNLIYAVDKINVIVDEYRKTAPENLIITMTGDSSTQTKNTISDLFNTVILGFIVVVFVLMFFMGETNALFVGIAIPMSIVIAFILIPVIGFTMNMVVLMSFILVLGIVVDNSIVVVENVYRHFTTTPDLSISAAARRGTGEVAVAVFTGTLTTMAPFFTLIFMPGIPGKFMSFIPYTVIITLTASMLVAYMINPVFAVSFMKRSSGQGKKKARTKLNSKNILLIAAAVVLAVLFYVTGKLFLANLLAFGVIIYFLSRYVIHFLIAKFQSYVIPRMKDGYRRTLTFLLGGKRPYAVIVGIVGLLFLSFILLGIRMPRVVFFPSGDPNSLQVYITMPEGTHIDVTNNICKQVEERIYNVIGYNNPDVESIVSNVASNAGAGLFERFSQDKLAKVTISFVEYKYRTGVSTREYLTKLRKELTGIAGAQIRIDSEMMGPPTGYPINMEISGDDIDELIDITYRLEEFIQSLNVRGIEELKSSMEVSKPELILNIDREKANRLGISTAQVGMVLRTAIYGTEVSKFKEGEEEYPVMVRLDEKYRNDVDVLLSQEIVVSGGQNGPNRIPISSFAHVTNRTSYGGVTRLDNRRVITLFSNVLFGYNANEIIRQINRQLHRFELKDGYSVKFTGEQDFQAEVGSFMVRAFFIASALILIILVGQFNSISKPLIIILQIVLSLTGVFLGFAVFRMDISVVMTGMGIIAVAGIVVKNAIIIVDYTDKLIDSGMEKIEAIVRAGATRLTPVLLTALSTILGLAPLAVGININFITLFTELRPQIYFGGDSPVFWNPLVMTIIFGLSFATVLTLVVVPALYKLIYARKS
ncbi:MAG: AcrB/AcrD/AcrF family protein [Candidatus Aminicenantes bacterium]|nr:AcrB/AcrD/AcrF family protein [Candidatus Aminicenantes bacterium]